MRNCILGGDNFRAFRVDLGGQNSKGDNFQLYRFSRIGGIRKYERNGVLDKKAFTNYVYKRRGVGGQKN